MILKFACEGRAHGRQPVKPTLLTLSLLTSEDLGVFSSLSLGTAVVLHPPTNVVKVLRPLGKSSTSQKSSLIGNEKANKEVLALGFLTLSERYLHARILFCAIELWWIGS